MALGSALTLIFWERYKLNLVKTKAAVQKMEHGLNGVHGSHAQLHVKKESKRGRGPALTHRPNVVVFATATARKPKIVTQGSSAQLMEAGLHGVTGVPVQGHVK